MFDLSTRAKYALSGLILGVSAALFLGGVVWFWGWAVGGVLLACTFLGIGED